MNVLLYNSRYCFLNIMSLKDITKLFGKLWKDPRLKLSTNTSHPSKREEILNLVNDKLKEEVLELEPCLCAQTHRDLLPSNTPKMQARNSLSLLNFICYTSATPLLLIFLHKCNGGIKSLFTLLLFILMYIYLCIIYLFFSFSLSLSNNP